MSSSIDRSLPAEGSKPVSAEMRAQFGRAASDIEALQAGKQDALVSGTNIKTVNGTSLLGSGDIAISGGGGSVTSVSVTTANGVSGTVATPTTTPAISLTLGVITPTSVAASGTVTGSNLSGSSSGSNTGDETGARIGALLNAAAAKTTPVDADEITGLDSAASFGLIRMTWANVKATLKTYFHSGSAAIGAVGSTGITMSTARLLGRNTASTGAIEEITLGTNLSFSGTTLNAFGGTAADTQFLYNSSGAVVGNAALRAKVTTGSGNFANSDPRLYIGQAGSCVALSYQSSYGGLVVVNEAGTSTANLLVALLSSDNVVISNFVQLTNGGYIASTGWETYHGMRVRSDGHYAFSSTTSVTGTPDAAIKRDAANRVSVVIPGGSYGDLKLRSLISSGGTITLSNYTVATLPTAASNTHAIVAVTDGNASPTYRGAVTGGGSTKGVVYCDGSSWMWH